MEFKIIYNFSPCVPVLLGFPSLCLQRFRFVVVSVYCITKCPWKYLARVARLFANVTQKLLHLRTFRRISLKNYNSVQNYELLHFNYPTRQLLVHRTVR